MGVEAMQPGGPGSVLTVLSATLGADFNLPLAATGIPMVTAVLAVGTWVLDVGVTVANGNAAVGTVELEVVPNTAVATVTGQQSAEVELPSGVGQAMSASVTCVAVVATAGTFNIGVKAPGAAANTVKATTPTSAFVSASGWVASRVA
jgi:hypothetical protein